MSRTMAANKRINYLYNERNKRKKMNNIGKLTRRRRMIYRKNDDKKNVDFCVR